MSDAALHTVLREFVATPEATQAISSVGGAQVMATAADLEVRNAEIWKLLNPDAGSQDPPPAPPAVHAAPSQLGPFNWSPIVFGGGVPVGGWSQLTLFSNGAYSFSGHFHDSGGTSYNVSCVYAVRSGDGTVFTFTHQGRVHGTFESGSRDDNWSNGGTNPAIAADWGSLTSSWHWHANAGANLDVGGLLDQTIKAVGTAAAVIAIV